MGVHKTVAVVLMAHDNLKHPTAVLLVRSQLMHDTPDGKPKERLSLALLPIETESKHTE